MAEDLQTHLQKAIVSALHEQKLAKGLNETCKALESTFGDNKKAALCILAQDVQEAKIKDLITALCKQHKVPLLSIASAEDLGKFVGLCKLDPQGNPRDIRKCSCAVIKEFVREEDQASLRILLDSAQK